MLREESPYVEEVLKTSGALQAPIRKGNESFEVHSYACL